MTATDVDGKEETTLLQEDNMGKAGRTEQGREEGKPDWFITFVGFSHGNLSGKGLAVPTPPGNPELPAVTFLPPVPHP